MAQTQRRIFAAYWTDLPGPRLLPTVRVDAPAPAAPAPAPAAPTPSASVPTPPTLAPPAPAAPTPSASAPTPAAPAPTAPEPAIDFAALDSAHGEPEVPAWAGQCIPTTKGAWLQFIDELWTDSNDTAYGKWGIGYVEPGGKLRLAPLSQQVYASSAASADELVLEPDEAGDFSLAASHEHGYALTTETFDWDGDGSEELFLFVDTWNMRRYASGGRIWTYRDGVLKLYPPTRNTLVTRLKDIDQDGRPDLILSIGSNWYLSEARMGSVTRDALELIAHSLPDGTFSVKDDVAVAFARQACAAATPTAELSTLRDVLCARIRGQSEDTVTQRLERTCSKDPEAGECDDLEDLHSAIAERPLLVLPPEH
ncbi:MAG TPA: hypothetical protein VLC09_09175 [Polyangiaceae bacterium]|nr:hypothetical protein [Polyangiaceae bacterium]